MIQNERRNSFQDIKASMTDCSTMLLASILCPTLIWMMLVGFFLAICFAIQDGIIRLKRLHQVPCSRCAFFTGDYRLKCAVHPCKALSEAAIDCLDYEPASAPKPVCCPAKTDPKKRSFLFTLRVSS